MTSTNYPDVAMEYIYSEDLSGHQTGQFQN